MGKYLQISHLAWPVTALGPGQRAALWVAGCPLRCKGCITPELQPRSSGHKVAIRTVIDRLLALPETLDGLTLTGGEPFAQADGLAVMLQELRQQRPSWNILVFSGFPLAYLHQQKAMSSLLEHIDLLVDGPFESKHAGHHPLQASINQCLHGLSPCGEDMLKSIQQSTSPSANIGLGQQQDWLIGIVDAEHRQHLHRNHSHPLCFFALKAKARSLRFGK